MQLTHTLASAYPPTCVLFSQRNCCSRFRRAIPSISSKSPGQRVWVRIIMSNSHGRWRVSRRGEIGLPVHRRKAVWAASRTLLSTPPTGQASVRMSHRESPRREPIPDNILFRLKAVCPVLHRNSVVLILCRQLFGPVCGLHQRSN